MNLHDHRQLQTLLQQEFAGRQTNALFTQWEGESEDEEVSEVQGTLREIAIRDNEFGTLDLLLVFEIDADHEMELLMELPKEEDLAFFSDGRLQIFGMDAELVLWR